PPLNRHRNLLPKMLARGPAVKRPSTSEHGSATPAATSIWREVAQCLGIGTLDCTQLVRGEAKALDLIDGGFRRQEGMIGPKQQAIGWQDGARRCHGARVGRAD